MVWFDDDGFETYIPKAVDPGYAILVATIIFSLLTNAMVPCMVALGRRYEKRRIARKEQQMEKNNNNDSSSGGGGGANSEMIREQAQQQVKNVNHGETTNTYTYGLDGVVTLHDASEKHNHEDKTSYLPESYVHDDADNKHTTWQKLVDQIIMPPYPDEGGSTLGGSAMMIGNATRVPSDSADEADSSILSGGTSILDTGARGARRQRRIMGDKELRRHDAMIESEADRNNNNNIIHHITGMKDQDGVDHGGMTGSELKGGLHPPDGGASDVASRVSHSGLRGRARTRVKNNSNASSALSGSNGKHRANSPVASVLSKMEDHIISPQDAADANDPGFYILPKAEMEGEQDIDLCCGRNAWWRPAVCGATFDRIVSLAEWDNEMKRLVRLSVPYSIMALLEGVVDTINVALVANYLGTEAVAAFTLVDLFLGLSTECLGGILASEFTLCSQAVGMRNHKLAGQYVQVCVILYTVLMIPNVICWSFFTDDVIRLFGFDEATAKMGQDYARVLIFNMWLTGVNYGYHGLMNVVGYENFATTIGVIEGICQVLATVGLLLTRETTLQELGLAHLAVSVVFFLFTVWLTICKGWMNKYLEGLVGSNAVLNKVVVRNVIRTSLPLALGHLLEYGEWEILTIFVAYMGTAEVAAWGILGSLWETFETLSNGIGDGGEVRCAYHLGNSNPAMAQKSAYKSTLLGLCASFFFTSILFIMGEDLAVWFTKDPTLQHMLAELLPLVGVGNIALTAGIVAWALVGAQGRYRLATLVAFVSSWCITMPLAAILTYVFKFNLQGVTASVVVGYSVTCTALFYILLRSDWERISKHVVESNECSDSDSSDDESSVEESPAAQS